ncbi:mandelate racemase/muconate lactonizing enzyme family protein, partial [Xanthomonas citri pv. citri]|nr:mandelate racemase/muconate lactonizing enzyme family protein [Xanthomonas citri pv. citri]MEA5632574.1 mandelate racemase/muconate lactonizing enzyme family protein [Bacillus velezensis]
WSKMKNDHIEPIEWDVMENPFTDLVSLQPSKGMVHIPKGKGIGTEINMEIVNRYKWDGSAY